MIYVIEENYLDTLLTRINKLEEAGEDILVGSISTYMDGTRIRNSYDNKLKSINPQNVFMATMRKKPKQGKVMI